MRKFLLANIAALTILCGFSAFAGEWSAEATSGYVSEYADRGTTVAGSANPEQF